MARRKGGFTLIELLVVITILVMLMTLLLPAVLRARLVVLGVLTKGRVSALGNACEAYYTDYNAYPTIIDNPPLTGTGHSPSKLSGCQNLRLALLGCARSGKTYSQRFNGPADDIDHYATSRQREPYFTAKADELVPHNQVYELSTGQDGAYRDIQVVVDQYFTPPRPLLYYRAQPRYITVDLYEFDDNDVYCNSNDGETATAWKNRISTTAKKGQAGYFIIDAGEDRVFFNSDDITNIAE